jgi:multimeric flavodoxin WrbA
MEKEGVAVEVIRAADYTIPNGIQPDMTKEGEEKDDWPKLFKKIIAADILVLCTPIWLGEKSSICTKIIERLYAMSAKENEKGQYIFYGKVGGCVITGNEDGIKHCGMDLLYALQHIGYTIPPQADCGWIGEAGPGPSYGDIKWNGELVNEDSSPAGYSNDFTNKNTTYMAWNLMHLALLLKNNNGIEAQGNTEDGWTDVANAKS